jgi:hypothetical protein
MWSTNSGWWQVFKYEDFQFINWTNKQVLEVKDAKDEEGAEVDIRANNIGMLKKLSLA